MFRISMPFVLLTLAACAPVAPVESAPDASAGASADAATGGGEPGDGTAAGGPGEVQPVPDEQIRAGPGLEDGACKADAAQGVVGRDPSEDVVNGAMRAAGAKSVRVIPHGGMVTMDYRGDRLNLQLDEQGKIVAVTCG